LFNLIAPDKAKRAEPLLRLFSGQPRFHRNLRIASGVPKSDVLQAVRSGHARITKSRPYAGIVLSLNEAHRPPPAAGRGGHTDLGMTIVGVAPAPTFEEAVRCGDLTEGNPAR